MWEDMQSPKPVLRQRPALLNQQSSSSLLHGLEQSVPSFKTFVKRTPPPAPVQASTLKSLPPVPFEFNDAALAIERRPSSVYSRTMSHWAATPESWKGRDLDTPEIFLQPSVYSYSSPDLVERLPTPPLLLPRTYSPLIESPVTSPESSPCVSRSPSMLLPPPPASVQIDTVRSHLRMVSLENAKAAMFSPSSTRLLPEELRAMVLAQTRPQGDLRESRSVEHLAGNTRMAPPPLPPLLNIADYNSPFLRPAAQPLGVYSQCPRKDSDHIERQDSGLSYMSYEACGRMTDRGPDKTDVSHHDEYTVCYGPPSDKTFLRRSTRIPESERLAQEYHTLLENEARRNARERTPESFESTKADIKLVPQPLFFNPRKISEQRARQYSREQFQQPPAQSVTPKASYRRRSRGNNSQQAPSELRLNLDPDLSTCNRRSTSGSIPISPPISFDSDASPTPMVGRFASPSLRAREESPHLINIKPTRSQVQAKLPHTISANQSPTTPSTSSGHSLRRSRTFNGRRESNGTNASSPRDQSYIDVLPTIVTRRIAAIREAVGNHGNGKDRKEQTLDSPGSRGSARNHMALDDAILGLKGWVKDQQPGMSLLRKSSVVSDMMDHRRESKASRRREQLKKTISAPRVEEE